MKILRKGFGNQRQLLPKKGFPSQPTDQRLLSRSFLELGKDLSKLENNVWVYHMAFSHDLTTVPAEMTAEIARFIDTPDDDKLFLIHHKKSGSVDFTICIPAFANHS
jgi:hypothetical protein